VRDSSVNLLRLCYLLLYYKLAGTQVFRFLMLAVVLKVTDIHIGVFCEVRTEYLKARRKCSIDIHHSPCTCVLVIQLSEMIRQINYCQSGLVITFYCYRTKPGT
jgi:hypothetical protein